MVIKTSRIPDKVLKGIFSKKLNRYEASEKVYSHLGKMILSGKLNKGQKLIQEEIVQRFNLNKTAVIVAFSRLRKEKLIITKRGVGSSVV